MVVTQHEENKIENKNDSRGWHSKPYVNAQATHDIGRLDFSFVGHRRGASIMLAGPCWGRKEGERGNATGRRQQEEAWLPSQREKRKEGRNQLNRAGPPRCVPAVHTPYRFQVGCDEEQPAGKEKGAKRGPRE